jgi:Ras-related protein Rab-2A
MFFYSNPIEYTIKCIVVGDSCVGKSCLSLQFIHQKFENLHDLTIGVEFDTYKYTLENGDIINMHIWDTAGQESFRSITRSYFRHSHCALIVFDLTNIDTYKSIVKWIADVKGHNSQFISLILVGNKCDLVDKRQVKREDIDKFVEENNLIYFETSARTGVNVKETFLCIIKNVYEMIKLGKIETKKNIIAKKKVEKVNEKHCYEC